ncbi:MAG: hypothetical protein ABG776_00060 [Cyanobacteria bacterium J06555_13]
MISTTFPLQRAADATALKSLSIIDLGNGDVKVLYRKPGVDAWETIKFPSLVAKLSEPQPGCFQVAGQLYLVGEDAKQAICTRTGASDRGKIDNALPLLVYALRSLVGEGLSVNTDLIFTSPSVKQYGRAIQEIVEGSHVVVTPADELAMISQREQTFTVGTVAAQLEGHRAIELVKAEIEDRALLVDVGNRTVLVSLVDKTGRIISRKAFDACGVRGIASRIVTAESLAGVDGLKLTPSEDDVMAFLFSKKGRKAKDLILPQVMACVSEALAYINDVAASSPVFLLGGGAQLPGLTKVLGGKVIDDPQWATVNGLKAVADALIARAQ